MYFGDTQRLMDRASLFMFVATVVALVSVITIMVAVVFLSNELPSPIAVKYFPILTFPGLNAVTGLTALSVIMALIGGFLIYMARSSLGRREFGGLDKLITAGIVMVAIAMAGSVGIYVVYNYYVGFPDMVGPLLLGTSSLVLSVALLVVYLALSAASLRISRELRRRYTPRRARRQHPPPPPPPQS